MKSLKKREKWLWSEKPVMAAAVSYTHLDVYKRQDFNNGNKLKIYGDSVFAPKDRIIIKKMAAQIGVSFSALLIRIKQLDMVECRPIDEYVEATLMTEVIG